MKRVARIAGVVAGLAVLGVAALHHPSIRARVLDRARAYAERDLHIALRASSLDYSLLSRSIELRDVSVASTSGAEPFLQADRIVVVFGREILRGRPDVASVSLSRPRLTLVRDRDGALNLPASQSSAGPSSPLRFGVVSVTALTMRFDDRATGRTVGVGPLDVSLDTSGASRAFGSIGPVAFTARAGDAVLSGRLDGRLAFDGTRVTAENVSVETAEGRVVIAGWADVIGERPVMSSHLAATLDLARVTRFAGVEARDLAGRLDGTADVTGPLTAPDVVVRITTRDARLAPIGPFQLGGSMSWHVGRAVIDTLDLASAAGSVHADGNIDPSAGARRDPRSSRLALRWSNLRIDELVRAAGYTPPIRAGSLADGSGRLEFDARDVEAREWTRLTAAGSTTLRPESTLTPQDSLALSGTAQLTLDRGRWSLRHAMQTPRARAALTGNIGGQVTPGTGLRSTLGGRSTLRVGDAGGLASLLNAVHVTLPARLADGLGGSIVAIVDPGGTIAAPRADVGLTARGLRSSALPRAAAIDARLRVDANGVQASELNASSGATSLLAEGRYGWRGAYAGRVQVTQGDVTEVAALVPLPVSVGGSAHIDATFTGERGTADAVVALSARDVVVDEVAIGSLTANGRLALAAGALSTIDAVAPDAGARAHLEIVNSDGYPVAGDVALEHRAIAALIPPRFRQQVGDVSGALSLAATGSGRLVDPAGLRGRVDLRALDVTARGSHIVLAAPASITVGNDRVAADAIDLRIGERIRATLSGELGPAALAQPARIRIDGPLAELLDVGTRTAGAAPAPVRSDGTATLDLTVGGTANHPLPNGTLDVRASSIDYGTLAPVTNVAVHAAIDPAAITIPAIAAQWRGASVDGHAVVPWRVLLGTLSSPALAPWLNALPPEPGRATLALRADNVTPAVLTGVLAADRLAAIAGSLSATLTADTDRFALDRIRAVALLDRASLSLAGVPITQSVPTRLRLEHGRASIEAFRWTAGTDSVVVTGSADLTAARPTVDAAVSGVVDLRMLTAFVPAIASAGIAKADLQIAGPADNPDVAGTIAVSDAALQMDSPRIAATDIGGTVRIAPGRAATVSLAGLVNTGRARLEGTVDLGDLAAPRGNLDFSGRRIALEFPSGLQTESNANLKLTLAGPASTLTGQVDVLGGTYREPLVLTTTLLNVLNMASASGIATAAPPTDWLSRLRLDVDLATSDDVRIDNNYGRLDVAAALQVVGSPINPGLLGRVQAEEDGQIYLGGNTYRIERLLIDLTSPRGIVPDLDFAAQTRVGDLPIGVELRCPPGAACERKITSLSNADDKTAEARLLGTVGNATEAGQSLARLLSGELLGMVGRTVGLDTVRLDQEARRRDIFDDPTLIAGDVDPAARLTLGKRLGSGVEVVFSQNLADSGSTWVTSYTGPHGLSGRVLILDDNSRSYEFRHEPIGGTRTRGRPRPAGARIAELNITGTPGFPEPDVRRQLRLTEGDRFSFAAWQRDRDRLARFYHDRAYLEARIRAERQPPDADGRVRLEYAIARGPATKTIVRGTTLPDAVRERIAERWTTTLFDGFLEKDTKTIVRDYLYRQGYLNATVAASVALDTSADAKTLTIDVVPGPIVPSRIAVVGNAALSNGDLLQVLKTDPVAAWLDPPSVEQLLRNHYQSEGFLAAAVSVGPPAMVGGTSVVTIAIVEGRPYTVGGVALNGLSGVPREGAAESLSLTSGDRYQPARVADAVDRLEAGLRLQAYRHASVDVDTRVVAEDARVDITVNVTAGPRSVLRDIVVEGDDAGKPLVSRAITLAPGAPLDAAAIDETRRRLYGLDVYRSVDISIQPVASAAASGQATSDENVSATITLEQRPRYRLRYGLAVTDDVVGPDQRDQQVGFAADFENRNVFGRGGSAGASLRLRPDQQVGRLSLGARRLFALPIRTTVFVEREREQQNPEGALPITTDISNLTFQQAYRASPSIDLRWGYAVEKNHTFIRSDEPDAFDITVNIARFTTGGVIDRRDDAFNPTRGWFSASTLELSTPSIGSDLRFLKDFTQYSHFVPLGRGLVVASAARLGLARTFEGEVLIPSERFYAGGANSVRGYLEDSLGVQSALGGADGGSALLVLNGELRFPLYKWLRGVGFVDAGNVYPTVRDISFTALQVGVGAGARLDTPFGLIRFDIGVPANPRAIDPRWRFHFGFGHSF